MTNKQRTSIYIHDGILFAARMKCLRDKMTLSKYIQELMRKDLEKDVKENKIK